VPDLLLSIDVDDSEAQAYFDYAGYHARDMRDPLRDVLHQVILPGIFEQFESEGDRSGGWQPLTERWEQYKMRKGAIPMILQFHGDMRDEMLGLDGSEPWRITHDELNYAVHDKKATLHQQGGWEPGRPPQREIIVITAEDDEHIEFIFTEWLDELRVANFRRGGVAVDVRPSAPQNIWVA
jgi:hypothetical protein